MVDENNGWCGVHFFVSVDVLLTFETVKLSDLEGRPGHPQRRIALVEGRAVPVTSYPAATLFLETLRASGNAVSVVAPWAPAVTASILRLFGWDAYGTCPLRPEPGLDAYRLSSVGCHVEAYGRAVVVVPAREKWDAALWPQTVEVRHAAGQPAASLALVRALSSCLRLAECRVRLPHTAVAAGAALTRAQLFAPYRFCIADTVAEVSRVALLINEHGGSLVTRCEDATHYVVPDPDTALLCTLQKPRLSTSHRERSSSSSTSTSSSNTSVDSSIENEDESILSDGEGENEIWVDDEEGEDAGNVDSPLAQMDQTVTLHEEETSNTTTNNDNKNKTKKKDNNLGSHLPVLPDISENQRASVSGASTGGLKMTTTTTTTSSSSSQTVTASTVTTRWLKDCVDGLLVYPPQVAHTSDDSSQWNISVLLLAVLLPPPDAEPISLSQINSIAEHYGFPPLQTSQTTGGVDLATILQKQWGTALRIEVKGEDLFLSHPPIPSNEDGYELKRQFEFIADAFCDTWSTAMRNKRLRNTIETGTQTAVVVTAVAETNTDAIPTFLESTSVEAQPQGRTLLKRALAPTEWAKELDFSYPTSTTSRPVESLVASESTNGLAVVTEPPPVWETSPETYKANISSEESKGIGVLQTHDDVKETTIIDKVKEPEDDNNEYMMCFIPTDGLGSDQETLDKDSLLRQPPFRNYPMKLTIDERGIHCLFVTSLDAKRFRQEGYAEVRNRFLPILPEYESENLSSMGSRKRRRSRSPVIKKSGSSSSRSSRKDSSSSGHNSQSQYGFSDARKSGDIVTSGELSKSDMELLNEIGATYDFALQKVDVVEHYALNDLADPVYRKQQHQLLRVVAKLKYIKANSV
ncbi:repressor activator protein 1 [Trypanosoma theileri]|uniref:Repressor activator protein 1 n=1 Tax=Trypanosoma theileri TaxID=67003 RepID=A0A1X0P4I3_9TRYP|nr:repressor activator protein 1 [Trypanosoma theileri]ORC91846.1 repressor activator protein 1 [Trypanosoma theileri]